MTVMSDYTLASSLQTDELFRNAFDYAAIGMAIVGSNGAWLDANSALCDIIGYEKAELLSTNFQAITHPDDIEADWALVQQVLDGLIATYSLEKRYIHKCGYIVWVLLSVSAIKDVEGMVLYFISQIQDITARSRPRPSCATRIENSC
jgi:PAS domain S-box-containing protein